MAVCVDQYLFVDFLFIQPLLPLYLHKFLLNSSLNCGKTQRLGIGLESVR